MQLLLFLFYMFLYPIVANVAQLIVSIGIISAVNHKRMSATAIYIE